MTPARQGEAGREDGGAPLPDRVRETLRHTRMLAGGETVVVGASGGPDSTALVHVLAALSQEFSLTLHTAHLNHGLRPDAGEDAALVAEMSRGLGLRHHEETVDTRRFAEREHLSLEDAGRRLRYDFLLRVAQAVGARTVATGHTLDDQAETVLMRLLRGSGPGGLTGIPPVRRAGDVRIIRPLLWTPRAEIETYLGDRGIAWREDLTNRDVSILRNRIRGVLLPALEGYNPDVRRALSRLADLLRDEVHALEFLGAGRVAEVITGGPGIVRIAREPFVRLPVALQRRAVREAVQRARGNLHAVGFVHIEGARRLVLEGHAGSWLALPGGVRVYRLPDVIEVAADVPAEAAPGEYRLPIPGQAVAIEFGVQLSAEELATETLERTATGRAAAAEIILDRDRAGAELIVRGPRPGDRFAPAGMRGQTKSVADYLSEEKIARHRRARVPVLTTEEGEILWIVGMRASEVARLTPGTTRALRVVARRLRA